VIDRWWPIGDESKAVTQSIRLYSPADLCMLLQGTGLALQSVESGGAVDYENKRFVEQVPLAQAMGYMASLAHMR
jgi:hypothetical protein